MEDFLLCGFLVKDMGEAELIRVSNVVDNALSEILRHIHLEHPGGHGEVRLFCLGRGPKAGESLDLGLLDHHYSNYY